MFVFSRIQTRDVESCTSWLYIHVSYLLYHFLKWCHWWSVWLTKFQTIKLIVMSTSLFTTITTGHWNALMVTWFADKKWVMYPSCCVYSSFSFANLCGYALLQRINDISTMLSTTQNKNDLFWCSQWFWCDMMNHWTNLYLI